MFKTLTRIIAAVALLVSLASTSIAADSKKPIRIPVHNWSSQVVMAYVIGGIFESIGNNVEYVPADSQAVYESIRQGDVDISHEVWQSAFGKSFDAARDAGGVLDWGDHVARSLEDMGYPNWVAMMDYVLVFQIGLLYKILTVLQTLQHRIQVVKVVG